MINGGAAWEKTTFGEQFKVRYGKASPRADRSPDGPVPVVGSAGQMAYTNSPLVSEPCLVIGRKGNVGQTHLMTNGSWPTDTIYYVLMRDDIDAKFLQYQLISRDLRRLDSSTATPSLRRQDLESVPLTKPPMEEQRQIVEILEDHLSRLDAAADYASAAAARLSNVDEASLRQQLAHVPFEEVALGKALSIPLSNGRSVPTRDGGFPVLRLTALRPVGVDLSARKGGAWSEEEARRFLVAKGDYLIARGNGSIRLVGRGSLVRNDPDPIAFPDTAIRARPNEATLSTEYLDLVWNSRSVRLQIESMARTTAGIYKVNQKQLASVLIPVPSLPDQATITRRLTETREQTGGLAKSIELAQSRALSLRRAVLAAAFSGKLTGRYTDDEVIEELAEAGA